jgi:hypothetical protein
VADVDADGIDSCATSESCNGADDDCNGIIDDGSNGCGGVCTLSPALGTACDGSDGDSCNDDSYVCDGRNATTCSSGTTNTESCNGADDNCDGTTDEGSNACGGACTLSPAYGQACDGPDGDLCVDDSYVCNGNNATVCSTGATNSDTSCNGLDEDCNGNRDPDTCPCATVQFWDDDNNLGCPSVSAVGSGNLGSQQPNNGACTAAPGGANRATQMDITPTSSCLSGSVTVSLYDASACGSPSQSFTVPCTSGAQYFNLNCFSWADRADSYRVSCSF